ncbi:hypothetical protein [Sphingomonas cavernae]|uniref:Flagellar export protein FliJ n=1 Tax=Sphingomonas cavernae TaxID=2320861 RepID=A0A418W6U9_9SPHN|nr:hypothetical protein [Sphingomonas cavernae]RJF85739.1 hypothetical protein D3876_17785 [Sphingomonas cavernae]
MKTPYDGAMRIQQSEIDDVRVAINVQVNQLIQIENSRTVVNAAIERETAIAADDIQFSSHAYVARMRAERARLAADQSVVDARLAQLRNRAVSAYGAFKATESAADGFREDAERTRANAEQAGIDDFTATSFVQGRQAARRAQLR